MAEQFGAAGSGMPLRHMSTAGSHAEAAESSGQPARVAPRVHRPVVRESDMRKFAGQVGSWHTPIREAACVETNHADASWPILCSVQGGHLFQLVCQALCSSVVSCLCSSAAHAVCY